MTTCKASSFYFETLSYRFILKTTPKVVHFLQFNPSQYSRCPKLNTKVYFKKENKNIQRGDDFGGGGGGGERKVHCEVEVISWRERRIKAEISVNADVDSVWNALTDYERLADFIPNLVCRYNFNANYFILSLIIKSNICMSVCVLLIVECY